MTAARVLEILAEDDRFWAAGEARRFGAAIGLGPRDQARLAVCVAELASNAAKHAGRGRIELHALTADAAIIGCRVRVLDNGPGILALEDSLRDGFSEGRWLTPDVPASQRRGLGTGLGAVLRMMSEVTVQSPPGGGLLIEAVLLTQPRGRTPCPRT